MGTWGPGHFENDGALDLLDQLIDQDTLKPLEESFDIILAVDGYIDVDYGEEAIAAAEVIALLRGKPAETLPDHLTEWHQTHPLTVDDALVAKAIRAVEKANDPELSEFRQLREEGEPLPDWDWSANITDLLERLRA